MRLLGLALWRRLDFDRRQRLKAARPEYFGLIIQRFTERSPQGGRLSFVCGAGTLTLLS